MEVDDRIVIFSLDDLRYHHPVIGESGFLEPDTSKPSISREDMELLPELYPYTFVGVDRRSGSEAVLKQADEDLLRTVHGDRDNGYIVLHSVRADGTTYSCLVQYALLWSEDES